MSKSDDERPARFLWLPPGLRPPVPVPHVQERILLLVGAATVFSGYDFNIFGMALPQIQAELHIPENQAALTIAYFRLAAIPALFLALTADLFGRRRLLLVTMIGAAIGTLLTAFAGTHTEFIWLQVFVRVFAYAEEMLAFVVIAEVMAPRIRGWSIGAMGALGAFGAGLASIVFGAVNLLPFGWRAIYVIGAGPLFLVAYFRRKLPETPRFEVREKEVEKLASRTRAGLQAVRRLATEHPRRLMALLLTVASFGFAVGPATTLMSKYLQQAHGYAPGEVTLLFLFGGAISLAGNFLAGRISDRVGRKATIIACALMAGAGYAMFYSGMGGWLLPLAWIVGLLGYLSGDALVAGYPSEIFPTAYRATASGLRYLTSILFGALGLTLEGPLYDWFVAQGFAADMAHGPAILLPLLAIPVTVAAVLMLPEPAGRTLEEMTEAPA